MCVLCVQRFMMVKECVLLLLSHDTPSFPSEIFKTHTRHRSVRLLSLKTLQRCGLSQNIIPF